MNLVTSLTAAIPDIAFPNLGIYLEKVSSGIDVFGFRIAFYGMIIALGMVLGYLLVEWQAKRTGQNPDLYLDVAFLAIPLGIIGARLYYVIFRWEEFKGNLLLILNLRNGGLGIYGGILMAILTIVVFCKYKKIKISLLLDTACAGLLVGQILGRWGNFFNREAFGGFAGESNLLAMQLPWDVAVRHMSSASAAELLPLVENGTILVHPTFLYESMWNVMLLILILSYTKRKKFDGELASIYVSGYGLGRFWIESLRTDQLLLWNTNIPVSMVVATGMVVIGISYIVVNRWKLRKASL